MSPTVEVITNIGEFDSERNVYRVLLSGDPDWNKEWRSIHIAISKDHNPILPGDIMWYNPKNAYWTLRRAGVRPKNFPIDVPFQRIGNDCKITFRSKKK